MPPSPEVVNDVAASRSHARCALPLAAGARAPSPARPAAVARAWPGCLAEGDNADALAERAAALAARLVDQRSWEGLGFARLDDYGRERLGHSARSLYDRARGQRRLVELPRVRRALRPRSPSRRPAPGELPIRGRHGVDWAHEPQG